VIIRRPIAPEDREACLALFDGNTPPYFLPHERREFEAFLGALPPPPALYLVLIADGAVAACGGIAPECDCSEEPGSWALCWGMVERTRHRRGLGRRLLRARLAHAALQPGARVVRLVTSQYSCPFFQREGFRVTGVKPGGFGAGLDAVSMVLDLVGWRAPDNP
jgi:GNAT superfamily N-acetyltransferase